MESFTRRFQQQEYTPNYALFHVRKDGSEEQAVNLKVDKGVFWKSADLRDLARQAKEIADRLDGRKPRSKTERRKLSPAARQILTHLETKGSISGVEANAIYKQRSLPRRILDIKEFFAATRSANSIRTDMRQDATGQKYARYSLVKGRKTSC